MRPLRTLLVFASGLFAIAGCASTTATTGGGPATEPTSAQSQQVPASPQQGSTDDSESNATTERGTQRGAEDTAAEASTAPASPSEESETQTQPEPFEPLSLVQEIDPEVIVEPEAFSQRGIPREDLADVFKFTGAGGTLDDSTPCDLNTSDLRSDPKLIVADLHSLGSPIEICVPGVDPSTIGAVELLAPSGKSLYRSELSALSFENENLTGMLHTHTIVDYLPTAETGQFTVSFATPDFSAEGTTVIKDDRLFYWYFHNEFSPNSGGRIAPGDEVRLTFAGLNPHQEIEFALHQATLSEPANEAGAVGVLGPFTVSAEGWLTIALRTPQDRPGCFTLSIDPLDKEFTEERGYERNYPTGRSGGPSYFRTIRFCTNVDNTAIGDPIECPAETDAFFSADSASGPSGGPRSDANSVFVRLCVSANGSAEYFGGFAESGEAIQLPLCALEPGSYKAKNEGWTYYVEIFNWDLKSNPLGALDLVSPDGERYKWILDVATSAAGSVVPSEISIAGC